MTLQSTRMNIGFALVLTAGASVVVTGCTDGSWSSGSAAGSADVGGVGLALSLAPGVTVLSASYSITEPNGFSKTGTIDVAHSTTLSAFIGGLPAAAGYTIEIDATTADGATTCAGTASFAVTAQASTAVSVDLTCHEAARTGGVAVTGTINICPVADGVSANPADVAVGFPVSLAVAGHDSDAGPAALTYRWSAPSGSFSDPTSATPSFVCSRPGPVTLTATLSDGDATPGCSDALSLVVTCEPRTLLVPRSLVISSSTYNRTVGAVATLAIGTPLAGSATATASAVAGGNYVRSGAWWAACGSSTTC